MGRARKITRRPAGNPIPKIAPPSFYAYEPPTEDFAPRLTIVHRWSNLPGGGGGGADPRHCVTIATIVDRVIVGTAVFRSDTEASKRFKAHANQLGAYEISVVAARDHYAEITGGDRFDHCAKCSNVLEIAARWCGGCGTAASGRPITAAQARAELAST